MDMGVFSMVAAVSAVTTGGGIKASNPGKKRSKQRHAVLVIVYILGARAEGLLIIASALLYWSQKMPSNSTNHLKKRLVTRDSHASALQTIHKEGYATQRWQAALDTTGRERSCINGQDSLEKAYVSTGREACEYCAYLSRG